MRQPDDYTETEASFIEMSNKINAQVEHLRLKEEECKKFQNDKEELVEALQTAIDELRYFYTQESLELCDVNIEAKNLERLAGFSKLLEKHKCD